MTNLFTLVFSVLLSRPHVNIFQVTPSDYICFINRDDTTDEFQSKKTKMDLSSAGLKLAGNSQHSRVKSMDELLLEESMRRNKRNIHEAPDLTIMGANAPGYQVTGATGETAMSYLSF